MFPRTSAAKVPQASQESQHAATLAIVRDGVPGAHGPAAATLDLSLPEFSERLERLARQEIVCVVSISHTAFERWHRGTVQRIKQGEGRFEILGDNFALYLREDNIGTIRLIDDRADPDAGPAIELHNRAGHLLARLQGEPEPEANARWRGAMGGRWPRAAGR